MQAQVLLSATQFREFSLLEVVPEAGVEPARGVTPHDFESCMTASSITPALADYILTCEAAGYNTSWESGFMTTLCRPNL